MTTDTGCDSASYLRRLEKVVNQLLGGGALRTAPAIWKLQITILQIQRDVQRSIGLAKASSHREALDELRGIRWHARRLGDALAFLLLGLDKHLIFPLSQNSRVRISAVDHGTRGVEAAAFALSEQGWGFPLLHDITDCLRIGDISFITRADGPKGPTRLRTVEIKTLLKDSEPTVDGRTKVSYQVKAMWVADEIPTPMQQSEPTPQPGRGAVRPVQRDRTSRQMSRLRAAKAYQLAEPNLLTEVDGQPLLSTSIRRADTDNAAALQRAVRRARRNGFGSETVEGAWMYVALYDAEGVDVKRNPKPIEQIPRAIIESEIWAQRSVNDAVVVHSIPPLKAVGAQVFLPYFLYPIPRSSVLDLMHGRMIIFVLVNPARLVSALESTGFRVSSPSGRNDLGNDSLVLSTEIESDDGARLRVDLTNLQRHIEEMLMEFGSLRDLVAVALAMRDSAQIGIRAKWPSRLSHQPPDAEQRESESE